MQPRALTEILGTPHPLLQGGMSWIGRHQLAAAISSAGALGVIGAGGMEPDELREEIRGLRTQTDRPFGINFPLIAFRPTAGRDVLEELLGVAMEERVPVVVTGAGSPARYTARLKEAGIVVVHVVPSARLAVKAEGAGVDVVVAESADAGGHIQVDGLSTFALLPQVVDAVSVPVVAAGGISDARGVAAARMLGAAGVQLGTRFVATTECAAHPAFKQALLEAGPEGATIYCRDYHASRALVTPVVRRLMEMERDGYTTDEVLSVRGQDRARWGCVEGDVEEGILPAGAAVGLVHEIKPAAEVVSELMEGCSRLLSSHEGGASRDQLSDAA